ncbi:DUF4270 family protein [Chitinophaga costaii]|nr:DUF4270 family protein [Chitinophaga costaii]
MAMVSCDKTGFQYDGLIDPDHQTNYTLADSLTASMRTFQLDSVITSGSATILTGEYTDPSFGTLTAGSYFHLQTPATTSLQIDQNVIYDSTEFVLKPNKYYYGDSMSLQTINVHKLKQKILLPTTQTSLYNNETWPYDPTPIGSWTGTIRPNIDSFIHIRLPDAIGRDFLDQARRHTVALTSQADFLNYFGGISIQTKSGNGQQVIMGFKGQDTSVYLRVHYHLSDVLSTPQALTFQITDNNLQFNSFKSNRSGTPLAAFDAIPTPGYGRYKSITTDSTGHVAYIQASTGLVARLDFPTLGGLLNYGKFTKVLKAVLILRPENSTYRDLTLPPKLALCEVDKYNNVLDTLSATTGGTMYGNLVIDKLMNEQTAYTYDISSYINSQISIIGTDEVHGIMIMPNIGDFRSRTDRILLTDGKHSTSETNRLTIQVYYLTYQ